MTEWKYPCCVETAESGGIRNPHYHCGSCQGPDPTSMYGHHTTFCRVTRTKRDFHACCPEPFGCELEKLIEGPTDD